MDKREAQEKAIRSKKDEKEEEGKMDKEGRVHKCKKCGTALKSNGDCPKCE